MKQFISFTSVLFALLFLTASFVFGESPKEDKVVAFPMEEVSKPKLEIDERVIKLEKFLERYNSPLTPHAKTFIEEADKHNIDWRLVPAIAGIESTFGKRIPYGSYNAWGYAVYTGKTSGAVFNGWDQGIATLSNYIEKRYYSRGLTTPEQIGPIYAPPSRTWAGNVNSFIAKIDAVELPEVKLLTLDL